MKNVICLAAVFCVLAAAGAKADSFGTFTIDFVTISGSSNPTSGCGIVNNDYRIGKYEIANDQWNAFTIAAGMPTGSGDGYSIAATYTGSHQPTNNISWYEAAQFANWLNTEIIKGARNLFQPLTPISRFIVPFHIHFLLQFTLNNLQFQPSCTCAGVIF